MKGYGQYCPIARASEIFAERWTPLIVRNLLLGCRTFSEIERGAPGISRTLLSQRLRTLVQHGLVERRRNPDARGWLYFPTPAGQELWDVCIALGNWGARWLEVTPEHLDPYVVLWSMTNSLARSRVPERRIVVRFDFPDRPKHRFWLLLENREGEVCVKHPGGEEDLILTADSEWFAKWHMGRVSWNEAARRGSFRLEGSRELARAFPTWDKLSHFARVKPLAAVARA
jgi:DNA-binding HxlR family transcriptional regulator